MKKLFLPQTVGRFEFLIFSVAASVILSLCLLMDGGSVLGFAIIAPFYWIYGLARVRSWEGKTKLWGTVLMGVLLMVGVGIVEQFKLNSQIPHDMDALVARSAAKIEGKNYMPTPQGYVADLLEVALFLLAVVHLRLQFKRGKNKSEDYEAISSDINDRLELWQLRRQKCRLERQKKIEELKKEIESQKN